MTDDAQDKIDNFNSIKVRLERSSVRLAGGDTGLFQFHKGAIRTVSSGIFFLSYWISIP